MREKGVPEMKRSLFLAAGAAAGLMLLAPAAALATTPTPTPTAPSKPAAKPEVFTVTPGHGLPGARVRIAIVCDGGAYLSSKGLDLVKDGIYPGTKPDTYVLRYDGYVRNVRPGNYTVDLRCHKDGRADIHASVPFVVEAKQATPDKKQVAKVPSGAPQTGGTDGPIDEGPNGVALAAGAMGVLAAGGAGLVALGRRRRTQ